LARSTLVCNGQVSGRHEADGDVGVGQVGRFGHVHDIGQCDDAAAETDRGAVDRGDDRNPAAQHVDDELAALPDHVVAQSPVAHHPVKQIEVATGGERTSLTGDHRRARVAIGAQLREHPGQREMQLVVDRVELLRT
jgi:hypothetical protein